MTTSPRDRLDRPDNRLYLGKGGSGKSTLVRSELDAFDRVLIHDTAAEPENANLATDVIGEPGALVARLRQGGRFRIAWRGFETMGTMAFEVANRAAWAAENLVLVWEEVDIYTNAGSLPDVAYRIVHLGRHRGLRTMATGRAPARVPRNLTRNVQRIVAFQTTEPRDLAWLADVIGAEAAARLPALPPFSAVVWDDQAGASTQSFFDKPKKR